MKNTIRLWKVLINEAGDLNPWETRTVHAQTAEQALRKALPKRKRLFPLIVTEVSLIAQTDR